MPLANDPTAPSSGIKKPRKPRTPRSTSIAPVPAKVTPRVTPHPVTSRQPLLRQAPADVNFRTPTVTRQPFLRGPQPPVGRPEEYSGPNAVELALDYMKRSIEANAPNPYGQFTQNNFPNPSMQGRTDSPEVPKANPKSAPTPDDNYSPYSNYNEGLQGNPYDNYAKSIAATGGYPTMNSDSPANPDREPSQVLTDKEIRRRLSRRGGFGLYGAISPIQGFDFDADRNTFGHTVDPITGAMRDHTGEDMGATMGTPIYAPVGGVVETATPNGGAYGNQIVLNHGAGEESMYGHLSGMTVQPGDKVKKGDLIGYVGSTGRSTGPHLHWETWKDGQQLDPNTLFGRGAPPQEVLQAAMAKFAGQQAPSGPPASSENNTPNELAKNDYLNALMQAIREQESSNTYEVQNGIGAMGAYQIMPSNIEGDGGWDMEALGHNITGQEFLNSPTLQNDIARFKLREYFKQYGAGGAAKAWYAGPGNATLDSNAPQYGGPSVNTYADSVLALMRKYLPGRQ